MSTGMAPRRGPVRHWRYAQASPVGHGVSFCPSGRRGKLTCLSVFVRGLGTTAPARANAVLDMNPQVWPVMATGYIKACQSLSWCQSFDPGPYAWTWSGWRRYRSPSDETKTTALGSGETKPTALGSGETEPADRGRREKEPAPK